MSRVVLVDDHLINLELMEFLLEAEGFEVSAFTRAEDVLQEVTRSVPDLFVLDVQLPGMSGLELLRSLRNNPETARCCIVIVTSYAMDSDREKALQMGCTGYITKPINTRTFGTDVRRFFEQGHLQPACSASVPE